MTERGDTHAGESFVVLEPHERIPPAFQAQIVDALRRCGDTGVVIVDLRDVPFIDSAAVGLFISATRGARTRVILTGLRPEIDEIFRLTKLDELLTIRASTDDALREFVAADA